MRISKESLREGWKYAMVAMLMAFLGIAAKNAQYISGVISTLVDNPVTGIVALSVVGCGIYTIYRTVNGKSRKGSLIVGLGSPGRSILIEKDFVIEDAIAKDAKNSVDLLVISPTQSNNSKEFKPKPYVTRIKPDIRAVILEVAAGLDSLRAAFKHRKIEEVGFKKAKILLETGYNSVVCIIGKGVTGPTTYDGFRLSSQPPSPTRINFFISDPDVEIDAQPVQPAQVKSIPLSVSRKTSLVINTDGNKAKRRQNIVLKPTTLPDEQSQWMLEFSKDCAKRRNIIVVSSNLNKDQNNPGKKSVILYTAVAASSTNSQDGVIEEELNYADGESSKWGRRAGIYTHSNPIEICLQYDINNLINNIYQFYEKRIEMSFPTFDYDTPLGEREDAPVVIGVGKSDLLKDVCDAIRTTTGRSDTLFVVKSIDGAEYATIVIFLALTKEELDSSVYKPLADGWSAAKMEVAQQCEQ